MELIFLGACSNNTVTSTNNRCFTPEANQTSPAIPENKKTAHPSESKGGQVIESGSYHLEFVSEPENRNSYGFLSAKGTTMKQFLMLSNGSSSVT